MSEREDDSEFSKWLSGGLSDQEFEQSQPKEDVAKYRRILSEVDAWSLPKVDKAKGYDELLKLRQVRQKRKEARVIPITSKWVGLAAASVALILVGIWVFLSLEPSRQVIATAIGETKEAVFPDGSKAVLNSNSSISFLEQEWSQEPEVTLERGEAYFYGDHSDQFRVLTDGYSVEVLGTRFSVKIDEQYFVTACYDGEVAIQSTSNQDLAKLSGGEMLRILPNGELIKEEIEDDYPIWIEGNMTKFANAPLLEVFGAIEDQFGIELRHDEGVDLNQRFTGSFVHTSAEVALKMVCDPASLQFEKVADKVYKIF
ncbi:MAG: FecR domain-containing protein [Bacteroidota bacterium]